MASLSFARREHFQPSLVSYNAWTKSGSLYGLVWISSISFTHTWNPFKKKVLHHVKESKQFINPPIYPSLLLHIQWQRLVWVRVSNLFAAQLELSNASLATAPECLVLRALFVKTENWLVEAPSITNIFLCWLLETIIISWHNLIQGNRAILFIEIRLHCFLRIWVWFGAPAHSRCFCCCLLSYQGLVFNQTAPGFSLHNGQREVLPAMEWLWTEYQCRVPRTQRWQRLFWRDPCLWWWADWSTQSYPLSMFPVLSENSEEEFTRSPTLVPEGGQVQRSAVGVELHVPRRGERG